MLAIAAAAIVASDFGPGVTKLAACVSTIANSVGLFLARDSREPKTLKQMKLPYLSILLAFGLCASMPAVVGCKTTATGERVPDTQKIAGIVKVAAYVGTSEGLKAHPEWRTGFETAAVALGTLETAETLDMADILAVVDKLPLKQLKSDKAVLLITSGTILLQELGGSIIPLDTSQLQPIAKALREGVQLGLGQTPPPLPEGVSPG